MTSLDRRLNSLYAIKKCSSCGSLYTKDCGCSKGNLEDKILVPVPNSSQQPLKFEKNCLGCGDPVHGLYCRRCALIRKTLEELFLQDASESSDDNTNVVNAPQEQFNKHNHHKHLKLSHLAIVVKQVLCGVNSSHKVLHKLTWNVVTRRMHENGNAEEQAAKDQYGEIPVCYDDDDFALRYCSPIIGEFNSEYPTSLFSSTPIPVKDSDSLMEEIDIFIDGDDSIPPGIESDNFDSEDDDNSTSRPEFESFHVDYLFGMIQPLMCGRLPR
ncbi:hypothetical protein Tco_0278295 [Tanacetum coccineum]